MNNVIKNSIILAVLLALGLIIYGVVHVYSSGNYFLVDGKPVPYRNDMQKYGTYPQP